MADSDLSDIPSEAIRTALRETIEKKLKSKNYKISVSSASKAGESNFVGIVHRVSFSKDGGKQEKLILKVAPQNEARRDQFNSHALFLQEINVYDKILPYFRKFEESKGVVVEESGFVEYAKCYGTIDEKPIETLFLEDLSVREFSIIDRYTQDVTADHVYLFMNALSKFHAISFALKDQQPEKLKELRSHLDEMFLRADDAFIREFFDRQAEGIYKVLANEEDADLLAKMKKVFENGAFNLALECLDLEGVDHDGAVIAHGDSWQNNLMFRYDRSGKPIEISLLDWQVSRYSSPVIDIVYFIFCCTTKELRDAHYDDFLKVYHESLSAHIRRLGSDPEKLFPYAVMLEHFRKYAKFGLVLSTILLPMITTDRGNGIDLDEMAAKFEKGKETNFENDELDVFDSFISDNSRNKFNKRLRDVVVDMVRMGYV